MRLAILSDIHGNLLALEAVLADLDARGGADQLAIAGDICLGGPRPLEALERVRALGCPVVQGNTDRDLVAASHGASDAAEGALLAWTRERLGDDGLAYLRGLPFSHRIEGPRADAAVLVVHANPKNLDDPLRPFAPVETIAPFLDEVAPDVAVVAFGHLHIPYTRSVGRLLLADIASVGLPKDGDRRAGYGMLTWQDTADGGEWAVELRRVEYPVEQVVEQLREAQPPDAAGLVRALLRARYPNMTEARGGRPARPSRAKAAAPPTAAQPADSNATQVAPSGTEDRPPLSAPRRDRAASGTAARTATAAAANRLKDTAPPPLLEEALPAVTGPDTAEAATLAAAAGSEVLPQPRGTEGAGAGPGAAQADAKARRKAAKEAKRAAKQAATPEFAAAAPFGSAVGALLVERLRIVLAYEAGVRAGDDPEAVHDMRVGIRRLRAALDAARPFAKPKPFRRRERALKDLADALGAVRDADVLLEFLVKRSDAAANAERPGLTALRDQIAAQREEDRTALLTALDEWHDDGVAGTFERFARQLRGVDTLVGAVARQELAASVAKFADRLGALTAPDDIRALHRLRIAAKQLRYTLELFSAVLGDDAPGLIADLKELQEDLGILHDRDVLAERLIAERLAAATRELNALAQAVRDPGDRADRLAAVRAHLAAPDSLGATADGVYGLLADVTDERRATFDDLLVRWRALEERRFLERLRDLAGPERDARETLPVAGR